MVAFDYCGDGIIQSPREVCDDGNTVNNDSCTNTCQIINPPLCGDGIGQKGEECDDGNTRDGDGCTSLCKSEVGICGDGIVQSALGEQCDDGNRVNDDDCDNACRWTPGPFCGDGIVQPATEQCDDGEKDFNGDGKVNSDLPTAECRTNCTFPYCGDGITDDPPEECDDGNNLNGDTCSAVCTVEQPSAPRVAPPTMPPYYPPNIPTPAKTPTGPGLVIFLASGAAAGVGLVRRRLLDRK